MTIVYSRVENGVRSSMNVDWESGTGHFIVDMKRDLVRENTPPIPRGDFVRGVLDPGEAAKLRDELNGYLETYGGGK